MKLSVSAYRAHASAHKKILSSSYQTTLNYGSTAASGSTPSTMFTMEPGDTQLTTTSTAHASCPTTSMAGGGMSAGIGAAGSGAQHAMHCSGLSPTDAGLSPGETQTGSGVTSKEDEEDSSNAASSDCKSPGQRTKSNQRWMKLRTTVQLSSAIQKKPVLKREDSFLKRFSTRQIPETQETMEETGSESASGDHDKCRKRRSRYLQKRRTVVNPDENFYFYWLMVLCVCVLYNLWTLIVRQSFPELQELIPRFWFACDSISDVIFIFDIIVQLRTGYLEQGLMVYDDKKLATHYMRSRKFLLDLAALMPLDVLQIRLGTQPLLRFPRFLKVYRSVKFYYIVESRTVWPNLWRVVNLIHILLILAHWFGCFYFLLSEVEGFQGDWVYPYRPGDYATLTRKYLGSLYWSTLTLTTIGDLPTPETNAEYIFTIVSYLIGVFIFATIVGQVGNVITNRNANRLEFERLLDGAKTYMRHHKVPGGMKRRVLRWYDYSWSRGRIQGGGDINTALGLLPDKLKTELALHVNLSVLKKVTIFQECQPEFLHDLVLKMKAYIFTPGDSICRKGEVAREMFIIADGILEVLSETGKVLTTMKAGDFFGEIGILNLDGLNKRTADVRSVGYSELFSLSREDVLTAMKDYPEAQEILQTLGRKRLMEVRIVNKKHAKHAAERENTSIASNVHLTHTHVHNSSENRTSKRIVDKLRSDVKGIKNALRKSRWTTGRKSSESIELQPLHQTSNKTPKGVLRRMPRVRSDEMHSENNDDHDPNATSATMITTTKEKSPSPIGAGLPLLQRLRLLKEKQDREERAVKSAPPMISPPHTHVRSAVSPQQSIQEEPEHELIGAGLPLLQRLKLLKAKEERLAKECHAKMHLPSTAPASTSSASVAVSPATSTANAISNWSKASGLTGTSAATSTAASTSGQKPALRVSFRDRVKALEQTEPKPGPTTSSDKEQQHCDDSMKEQLIPKVTTSGHISSSTKISKPSTSVAKDKMRQMMHHLGSCPSSTDDQSLAAQMKPWSKLKLATVVGSTGSSYTSLNSSMNEGSPVRSQPIKIAKIRPTTSLPSSATIITDTSHREIATRFPPAVDALKKDLHKETNTLKVPTERCSASDSEIKNAEIVSLKPKCKTRAFKVNREPKSYRSVDDLSPEYGGLPFVKKLKILNERQKLAELESVIMKTRSSSLDYPDANADNDLLEPLIRSHSEGSGMTRPKISTSIITASTTTATVVPIAPLNMPQCLQSPVSPESNETFERRQLKSILKKMSEERNLAATTASAAGTIGAEQDYRNLLDAPTVEGYVARHSKLMKSVTFNSTLSSPPASAHSAVDANENRSLFPLLNATHSTPINDTIPATHSATTAIITSSTTTTTTTTTATIVPPSSPQSQSDNSFIIDDSTNRLYTADHFNGSPVKYDPLTGDKMTDSSSILSKKFVKGSIEEHEYFGEVLLGIKHVIQNHLRDVQIRFQDRVVMLEVEIKHRDTVISQLQNRIIELEENSIVSPPLSGSNRLGGDSTGSSGEIPFVRGDSLDTIFASSPPPDTERNRNRVKSKKRNSPRRRTMDQREESTDQENSQAHPLPIAYDQGGSGVMIDDVTGNITRMSDSVVLNIENSSSASSSVDEEALDEQEDEEDDHLNDDNDDDDDDGDDNDQDLHCDDWEIRMLAAELNRRESKRDEQLSSETTSDGDGEESGVVHRHVHERDDTFDTDTEPSETEVRDVSVRPRAASLDQHNIRREKAKGVFKAFSFDRDKDRL